MLIHALFVFGAKVMKNRLSVINVDTVLVFAFGANVMTKITNVDTRCICFLGQIGWQLSKLLLVFAFGENLTSFTQLAGLVGCVGPIL